MFFGCDILSRKLSIYNNSEMKSWNGKNYVWMWILQRQLRYFTQRLNTTSTRYLLLKKKSPIFIHRPQEEEWGHFPLLDFFSFLNLDMPILDKRMPGASAARTTLGRRKGGRDLWEHWDESCLLRRCKLLLHSTSKFQVIGWPEWFSITISKVCDDRTQFGVWYRWQQEHFGQGK